MAKFLKVHHENDYGDIEEYIVNLEMIVDVDEESRMIDMVDGESIGIAKDNEWNKIMKYIDNNEEK